MGLLDTLNFDEEEYYNRHCDLSERELRKKHHVKVMLLATHKGGIATGIGTAALTGGTSLLGAAYSARQHSVLNQQKKILEQILEEQGNKKPRHRKRDAAIGVAVAAATLGTGLLVDEMVSAAADVAADAAADAAVEMVPVQDPYTGMWYYQPYVVGASSTGAQIATIHALGSAAGNGMDTFYRQKGQNYAKR